MLRVLHHRCTSCGGCVGVCPVGALELAETRVVVGSTCIACGDCIDACPVGALQLEARPAPTASAAISRHYDLVVIGAGPGGSTAARVAAQAGLSVLLLEKRQEIGSPVRCAEGVGHHQLAPFIEPDPRWIAAEVTQIEITAVTDADERILRASGGRGYILERRIFDRVLAERAARAGAEIRVKTAVTGLLTDQGRVQGVRIGHADFLDGAGTLDVAARVVIAADGMEAQVGRWAGLNLHLPLRDTMVCAQYLLAGVSIDPSCTYYTLDHQVAPGGYAWIFPKGEAVANVGLGMQADLPHPSAAPLSTPHTHPAADRTALNLLTRFIEAHPRLAQGYPVTLVTGNVPLALAPPHLVVDGLLVVGDAARQVDPLTGGGIGNAMVAGQLAAQVTVEALAAGDTSAAFLQRYRDRWHHSLGRQMQRNYRLRERFPPQRRTSERFLRTFALAVGG
jgi:digeranylgeranylglycerophospholipid reductase